MTPEQEDLVLKHMGLAQSIAAQIWKQAPHALELAELQAIAYLGLVGAANRWESYCAERSFDPKAIQYFEPFVKMRVRGAIMDSLRANDWATRSLRYKSRQLQQAGQDQGATVEEMASRTEMSVTEVRSTLASMAQRPVSLEGEEIDTPSSHSVESTAFSNDLLRAVVAAIRELSKECQVVLALHYFESRELQQVAVLMGITESRASHLHTDSVLHIRSYLLESLKGWQ